jgi:hypothetical protein
MIWIGLLMVLTGTFTFHNSPTSKLLSVTESTPTNEIVAQLIDLSEVGFEREAELVAQHLIDEVDVSTLNTPLPWKRKQALYVELQLTEAMLSIQPTAFELWKRKVELLEFLNRSQEAGALRSQISLWLYGDSP